MFTRQGLYHVSHFASLKGVLNLSYARDLCWLTGEEWRELLKITFFKIYKLQYISFQRKPIIKPKYL
jgi:hypothetical protein